MIDIDELDDKFSIEGEVGFAELEYDLVYVTVSNKYADADICLYGAHITSFKPHNSMEMLWMSPSSHFQEGFPIRGGIPICFPWFGPHKTDTEKPQHGFARLMYWEVAETASLPNGETRIRLQLNASEETKAYWPFDFKAEMTFTVGQSLTVSLKVTNTSEETINYTSALHTYFSVSAIGNISIEGLKDTSYHNQLTETDGKQEEEILRIQEPITRHYFDTEATCILEDPIFRKRIQIAKTGSKTTTVWNPGEETCKNIADMPDDSFHEFVCLETGNAYEDFVSIEPGESHETTATIGREE